MDSSLQVPVPGTFQVRILEGVAISSSRGSFWSRDQRELTALAGGFFTPVSPAMPIGSVWKEKKSLSRVPLFATPSTVAHQAPPSMEFSRQEYWGGLPFPSPGDLPDLGIEPRSPALQAHAFTVWATREVYTTYLISGGGKIHGFWDRLSIRRKGLLWVAQ